MTKETYDKHHKEYIGKHEKKLYNIWRVLGPAGPQESFCVYGIGRAREAVKGCWDYEVTTIDGKVVHI